MLPFGYIKVAIAAAVIGCVGFLYWQNGHLRHELIEARAELATVISEHNAAVEALKADSDRRQSAVQRAIETAPRARPRVLEAMKEPPRGATEAERMRDIDRRFMEALRP